MTDRVSSTALDVEVSYLPRLSWAGAFNDRAVVRRVRLSNRGAEPLPDLEVRAWVDGLSAPEPAHRIAGLPPGATLVLDALPVALSEGDLAAAAEAGPGSLWVEVANGATLHAQPYPVEILGADEWTGPEVLPELLAAFCRPDHPLTAAIAEPIGYAGTDPLRIADRLRVLHDHLAHHDLAPAPPSRRIRSPDQILADRAASGLDAALWIAAVLEACALHPLVALCGDRALVGVWLVDHALPFPVIDDLQPIERRLRSEEVLLVDALPGLVYGEAKAAAHEALGAGGLVIDVLAARRAGIRPLPHSGEPRPAPPAEDEPRSRRLERWKSRLLDLSMRNRLLHCKDSKGTLPLLLNDPGRFEDHLADGKPFTFEPRFRRAVEREPVDLPAVCPWCASPVVGGVTCRSCGGPLPVAQEQGNPLAGLALERLDAKVVAVDLPEAELERRLNHLYRAARTQLEASGANTLYVAIGLLRYQEHPTADKPRTAPLLLLPVQLRRKSVRSGYTMVRTDEDPVVNATLLQYLHQVHGLDCLPLADLPQDGHGVDVPLLLRRFRKLVEPLPGWAVVDAVWITQLSFTHYLMWRDLETRTHQLVSNLAVRQLLTDDDTPWPALAALPSPDTIDHHDVADVLCPLDADSSQLAAVLAAGAGHSFVLQGPPGTGKSQTITNLIAHTLAHGRTVLFVSEKVAALEVVHGRLKGAGLAPFCLELHASDHRKADVVRQLQEAFDAAGPRDPHSWSAHAAELQALRDQLSRTVRALHLPGPLGRSAVQAATELVGFDARDDVPRVDLDLGPPDALDAAALRDLVDAATTLRDLGIDPATSAWRAVGWTTWQPERLPRLRVVLADLDRAAAAVQALDVASGTFPTRVPRDTLEATGALAAHLTQCPAPAGPVEELLAGPAWPERRRRIAAWIDHGRRRAEIWSRLEPRWTPALLAADLRPLHERFVAWADQFVLLAFVFLFFARRTLGTFARGALGGHAAVRDDLHAALEVRGEDAWLDEQQDAAHAVLGPLWAGRDSDFDLLERLAAWADRFRQLAARVDPDLRGRLIDEVASAPERFAGRADLVAVGDTVSAFVAARDTAAEILQLDPAPWGDADDHPGAVRQQVADWRAHESELRDQVAWNAAAARLRRAGLDAVLEALAEGRFAPEVLPEVVTRSVLAWWLDARTGEDEALRSFHALEQDRRVARFRELDGESRRLALSEIRARLAARVPSQGVTDLGEMGVLNRELRKRRAHLATRRLFEAIPHVLQRIKPCVLMSPLSVAQYLDPALDLFDLVVFDEASQIPPWQAIGAMARGRQVVVVGDSKQLPPTSFFARGEDDQVDEEARRDLESILDECIAIGMPCLTLDWHYRSRHEGLIAFSNRHYYGDRLVTFPCARPDAPDLGVQLRFCEDGAYDKGRTRTNRPEAEALVAHVVATLSDPSHRRSVGIVTFSLAQQGLIEDLLDDARARDPSLDRWFSEVDEPVFVKNLESVQGDERDVICFSVCYGPDHTGAVGMNFGPLNRVGGERRLNVAITRARMQLLLFTSLRARQIDLSRTSAIGVEHLRAFLHEAERSADLASGPALAPSPLAADVAARLEDAGYVVDGHVGSGALRVELAVRHPEDPRRYVLGIETDGPAYAACPSARDRDRLRAEVLAGLGWALHRVWALAWLQDRERAWCGVQDALAAALQAPEEPAEPMLRDLAPSGPAPSEAPPPPSRHPEYRLATELPCADHERESFYTRRAAPRIAAAVDQVLRIEAPLHLSELTRRVGAGWGVNRVTAKPQQTIAGILAQLDPPPIVRDGFVWRADQDPDQWRAVRVAGHARAADVIPPEEVAAAVEIVLRGSVSSSRDALARGAARVLGIRSGARVRAAVDQAVALLVHRGTCTAEGDTVTLC